MVYENPKWDVQSLNLDKDIKAADDKFGATLNSDNPNLRAFKAQKGKLIQYHGWGDAAIPPQGSVDYFEAVQKSIGNTKSFYRLFMVPTMSHCAGGPGATIFGNAGGIEPPGKTPTMTSCWRLIAGLRKAWPPIASSLPDSSATIPQRASP